MEARNVWRSKVFPLNGHISGVMKKALKEVKPLRPEFSNASFEASTRVEMETKSKTSIKHEEYNEYSSSEDPLLPLLEEERRKAMMSYSRKLALSFDGIEVDEASCVEKEAALEVKKEAPVPERPLILPATQPTMLAGNSFDNCANIRAELKTMEEETQALALKCSELGYELEATTKRMLFLSHRTARLGAFLDEKIFK